MKKQEQLYKLTVPEFFLFNEESRIKLLKLHGKIIYYDFLRSQLILIVYVIYDFYIQVIRLISNDKIIEISPVRNGNDFSRYICLKGIKVDFNLS